MTGVTNSRKEDSMQGESTAMWKASMAVTRSAVHRFHIHRQWLGYQQRLYSCDLLLPANGMEASKGGGSGEGEKLPSFSKGRSPVSSSVWAAAIQMCPDKGTGDSERLAKPSNFVTS